MPIKDFNMLSRTTARATTIPPILLILIATAITLPLLLTACASSQPGGDQQAGAGEQTTISVSGAFALFPMMTVWTQEYQKSHPNVRFDVQAGGAGKGMTDMLAGAADIAMLSRDPKQEELDKGAFPVGVTIDAVVGVANANNPHLANILATGITPDKVKKTWIGQEIKTWGQFLGSGETDPIHVYTRADAAGAAEMWARFAGGKAQEELGGTAVNGDPGLAEAVRQDPLGIGYNNIGFAYDPGTGKPIAGLQILPIDLNANGQIDPAENFYGTRKEITQAIAAAVYPFPPARVLYLVTKGRPTPAIAAFLGWILTDGQKFVPDAGYVSLPPARIDAELAKLKEPQ